MAKSDHPAAALLKAADGRDTLVFNEEIRSHGIRFFKGMVAQFEDPAAAAYFDTAFNGTEWTDQEPNVVITSDELNFDPEAPGETIDPATIVGNGRDGIKAGISINEAAGGEPLAPATDGTLQVEDVTVDSAAPRV